MFDFFPIIVPVKIYLSRKMQLLSTKSSLNILQKYASSFAFTDRDSSFLQLHPLRRKLNNIQNHNLSSSIVR